MKEPNPIDATPFNSAVANRQAELGLTDEQITLALGFEHEGVIVMVKQGSMRLPIDKLVLLANVLELEAPDVLRRYMRDCMPGVLEVIENMLRPMTLTNGERRMIIYSRRIAKGRDYVPIIFDGGPVIALVAAA